LVVVAVHAHDEIGAVALKRDAVAARPLYLMDVEPRPSLVLGKLLKRLHLYCLGSVGRYLGRLS
jgi:hypothetical protein